MSAAANASPDSETIRAWLLQRVAGALRVEPSAIDTEEPLYAYGFDSIAAATLAGELEEWLGRRLPLTLLWDHPTIDALAIELSSQSHA